MPLYDFRCARDGHVQECLMSYEQSKSAEVICPHCGDAMMKAPSLVAKTATAWHGDWTDGLSNGNGIWSAALGKRVSNKRQEEKELNDKGFVSEKDLGKDFVENYRAKQLKKLEEQDKKADIYNKVLKETGSATKAVETAFPAIECLDGTIDKIYS